MRIYLLSKLLTCKIYVTVWLFCYIVKCMSDLHKLFTIRVHVNFYKMSLENVLSQL